MSSTAALDAVRSRLSGSLLLPGDSGFDAARLPWNLTVDQRPAAVAEPAGIDDLSVLVEAARTTGAPLAVQPSGHGASGDLEGAILVRMSAFDDLRIDADAGVLHVGSGVRWGTVIAALEGSGWAAPSGTSPVISVGGYTLGGGHSWFSRTAGLGSDNLRAAWVVRPDGSHTRVDDGSDPDLMWALRGAGGVVGIVTRLEIDLVRTPSLWGANIVFDAADSAAVIRAVRDLSADAPPTLNVFLNSARMPDAPQLPEVIRGRSFLALQALSVDGEADALLAAVRGAGRVQHEASGPTSPGALVAASTEPTEPMPAGGASMALTSLDDATIDALVAFRDLPEQASIIGIDLRMLGGALAAPRRAGFASLQSVGWLLHALAPSLPGAPAGLGDASLDGLRGVLAHAAALRTIPTFLGPGETLEQCVPPAEIERLRAVRDVVDPDGVLYAGRLPR
ncbi:FAD-binding oxidoreductase [Microbacterium sp. 179-I 3D2 NHS]|uniref:FAD-binding oxidoreductase n=1 Tax=Microbacterium sp. 179-I 3D2 NHS TaxID=3235178 RepID=UPI0039A39936